MEIKVTAQLQRAEQVEVWRLKLLHNFKEPSKLKYGD